MKDKNEMVNPLFEMNRVKAYLTDALYTYGAHHKQWYIEQVMEMLQFELSADEIKDYGVPEKGVAP